MTIRAPYAALPIALVLTVSACSNPDATSENAPGQTSVSGVANKGIIQNGIVETYPVVGGAVGDIAIATAKTNENGRYSLNIPLDYEGAVEIVIKPGEATTMKCDVIDGCDTFTSHVDFGAVMPLPSGFALKAIVPDTTPGQQLAVNITPFTHMAALLAESREGGLTRVGIAKANSEMTDLLRDHGLLDTGDSVLTTEPVDVTNAAAVAGASTGAVKYAFGAAAVARLAKTQNGGDLVRTLADMANTYTANDGELPLDNSAGSTAVFSMKELIDAARAEVGDNQGLSKIADGLDATRADVQAHIEEGDTTTQSDYDPSVGNLVTGLSDDITTAKSLVNAARTFVENGTMDLKEPADLFFTHIGEQLGNYQVVTYNYGGSTVGMSSYSAGPMVTMTEQLARGVGAVLEHMLMFAQTGEPGSYDLSGDAAGTVVVSGQTASVDDATVVLSDATTVTINHIDVTLPVDSGKRFTAALHIDAENDSGTLKTSTDAEVTFARTVPVGMLGDAPLTGLTLDLNGTIAQKHTDAVTQPVSFQGDIGISLAAAGSSQSLPSRVEFAGRFSRDSNATPLDTSDDESFDNRFAFYFRNAATFHAAEHGEENANHWRDIDITESYTAKLLVPSGADTAVSDLKQASITIGADRSGYESGSAYIDIAYDGQAYRLEVSGNRDHAVVTLKDQSGTTLSFVPNRLDKLSGVIGTIKVNGNTVATLISTDYGPKIVYDNGDFEYL